MKATTRVLVSIVFCLAGLFACSESPTDDRTPITSDDAGVDANAPGPLSDAAVADTAPPADGSEQADAVTGDAVADDGAAGNDGATTPAPQGWTNWLDYLVKSDGTRSLGDTKLAFNDTRDQGSKIVFVDAAQGDNEAAEVYWWDGSKLVDSSGSAKNKDGKPYGADPLQPNLAAIRPFKDLSAGGDPRLVTQLGDPGDKRWAFAAVAGGYPDWFLFRRGQKHTVFARRLAGGRSEAEPMVVGAYGPLSDGRAIFAPDGSVKGQTNPMSGHSWGAEKAWMHQAVFSIELRAGYGYLGVHKAESFAGGPATAYVEDCYWPSKKGGHVVYPPRKTTFHRCIFTRSYKAESHNQAYFTSGFDNQVTFDEVIMYKNGYKTDPMTDPDPRRDIFSRNIYQGGGAKMGHTYRNLISADGASGGPQMRLGATIENSLIIEGYWFSATQSNANINAWLLADGQKGQSAVVRNNVQLVFGYPTPMDPDTHGASDKRAQPKWGYKLGGATFGALVEGNIVSGAMLTDDLGAQAGYGYKIGFGIHDYTSGTFAQQDNVVRDNIAYRVKTGLVIDGDASGASGLKVEDNVFVAPNPLSAKADNLTSKAQLLVSGNRFYAEQQLPSSPWVASSEDLTGSAAAAAQQEGWTDPDRTLKRYVKEVLKLELLDWSDDPFLDPAEVMLRVAAKEAYDPAGLKTFMAVATRMRRGGKTPIPGSGKPEMTADYPWDERFTAVAVVNWIRAGFGRPPVK